MSKYPLSKLDTQQRSFFFWWLTDSPPELYWSDKWISFTVPLVKRKVQFFIQKRMFHNTTHRKNNHTKFNHIKTN